MNNFELALRHVLSVEGGFVNHKFDRGGATKYGVTRATLEAFRRRETTADDVRELTIEEASEVYRVLFWEHYGIDRINDPRIALAVFDQIVNRRASEVIRGLQVNLNTAFGCSLLPDGVLGPKTIEAVNRVRAERLIVEIAITAQAAYHDLAERVPNQSAFLGGWLARTWKLLRLV